MFYKICNILPIKHFHFDSMICHFWSCNEKRFVIFTTFLNSPCNFGIFRIKRIWKNMINSSICFHFSRNEFKQGVADTEVFGRKLGITRNGWYASLIDNYFWFACIPDAKELCCMNYFWRPQACYGGFVMFDFATG